MSAPKFQLKLSDPARVDFRDILSHTLQLWGERQFIEYQDMIDNALQSIALDPHLITSRQHPNAALRVLQVGRHRIFYRVDGTVIYVIRILHQRMDATLHVW